MVSGVDVMKIQPLRSFAQSRTVQIRRPSAWLGIIRSGLPASFRLPKIPARWGAAFTVSVCSCSVPVTRASMCSG